METWISRVCGGGLKKRNVLGSFVELAGGMMESFSERKY